MRGPLPGLLARNVARPLAVNGSFSVDHSDSGRAASPRPPPADRVTSHTPEKSGRCCAKTGPDAKSAVIPTAHSEPMKVRRIVGLLLRASGCARVAGLFAVYQNLAAQALAHHRIGKRRVDFNHHVIARLEDRPRVSQFDHLAGAEHFNRIVHGLARLVLTLYEQRRMRI